MKDTQLLYALVAKLPAKDRRKARYFLQSPYFNQREDVIRLFDHLEERLHILKLEIEKQAVFSAVYPGETFSDQKMRLVQSYLLKLMEEWLSLEEWRSTPLPQLALLPAAYRKRELHKHGAKALRQASDQLGKNPWRNETYYRTAFALETEQYQRSLAAGRSQSLNLQSLENRLHIATLSARLRQACFTLAHSAIFQADYHIPMLDALLKEAQMPQYAGIPAVSLYFLCHQALYLPPDEQRFAAFHHALVVHFEQFPPEEMRDLILLAINYCIRQINDNRDAYLAEALHLYKKGLESELLLEGGRISRFTYNNATGIALRLKDWAWADWLVHAYRDKLDPAHRDATYCLNAARLHYAQQHYREALLLLQKADYKDIIHNLTARTLQLKIYFELQEYDLLDAHVKNMYTYLRRNKQIGYHQRNYLNIAKWTQRIMTANLNDPLEKEKIRRGIEQEEPLTEKHWLLQQL